MFKDLSVILLYLTNVHVVDTLTFSWTEDFVGILFYDVICTAVKSICTHKYFNVHKK